MKFNDMPYTRPDISALETHFGELSRRLSAADTYAQAREIFLEADTLDKHIHTMGSLASIRHAIDTRDKQYDHENDYWNEISPLLQKMRTAWTRALLKSKFQDEFAEEFGSLMFVRAHMEQDAFCPENIPLAQQENTLISEYSKLIASASVPFEGSTYTLSQMTLFKNDPDDDRRLRAWKAEGTWYKQHQADLDRIYDSLVKVRTSMGKQLGYETYTPLGYLRMDRDCYGVAEVEAFREAVRTYVVPLADSIRREQAKRLGVPYPLSYADNELFFRSGNPRPQGSAEDILAAADGFYRELSPQTDVFWQMMRENELLDVLSTEGKQAGGFCTEIADYGVPFIFSNFNGTRGDVEVVTHEAGHAFAYYLNRDRVPLIYCWPSMEACEVHSMSMEFLAWPWSEAFFGEDADKFRYSHLASALTFIPYGTMVDHFQHEVYAKPDMTPAERHKLWKHLIGIYQPWLCLDADIPFYAEGQGWQKQMHIYAGPFYYIDYCLAQTVALEIWALQQKDPASALKTYMAYASLGGTKTFVELLKFAGLESPFDETCLKNVCETAKCRLDGFDMTSIK